MIPLIIDFETYYDDEYSLSKLTTAEYVMDPRFEVIGVGVRYGERRVWMEEHQFRRFARDLDWSKYGVLAHHAHFDGLILSHHYNARPGFWLDTLSMGRALHGVHVGGSLDSLMKRYGVGEKGDEVVRAKGKHRVDFTPEEWQQYGVYCINDCDGTLGIFNAMIPRFPRQELDIVDITVRMFTEPVLVLDQQRMAEYLGEEIKRKQELLDEAGVTLKDIRSNNTFVKLLAMHGADEPPTKKNAKGKTIYAFAKTDPGMQALLEHHDEDVRLLAETRIEAKSTLNVSRTARMLWLGQGGRPLPVYLKFSGAHTWRDSGGDGMNWQNLEKTNKQNPRKGMIRKSVRSPRGYKIVKADSSQIEARWNAWHNGQMDVVEQFARGEDIYSSYASTIYGRPVDRKANKEDELPGQVAKICFLGLGYGMGWYKLAMEVLMGRGGAPKIQFTREYIDMLHVDPSRFLANPKNIERITEMPSRLSMNDRMVHCAVTNHLVNLYRSRMTGITGGWDYWGDVIGWMFEGRTGPVGNHGVLSMVEGGLVHNATGLLLKYPHLEWNGKSEYTYLSGRGQRSKLYGGLVVENITQFCCRIVVFEAARSLTWGRARAGLEPYKIAQREHDALTLVVREDRAGEALNDLMQALTTTPSWAPGLPLAAEGGIGDTMGDAK